MTERLPTILRCFRQRIALSSVPLRWRLRRLRRGLRYGLGLLSKDEPQQVFIDCQRPAGWHPLLLLADDDVLDEIRNAYEDHPRLAVFVNDACAWVSYKWESFGEELYEARRWARNLVEDYARDDGIALCSRQPNAEDDHSA